MRARILTLNQLGTQRERTKKNASTQKDKANLVSCQNRLDVFFRTFRIHLEIWITDRNLRAQRL